LSSKAIDVLSRLFSLVDLIDYDTMIILPERYLTYVKAITHDAQSITILLSTEKRAKTPGENRDIYVFSTEGLGNATFWLDLMGRTSNHSALAGIKSLITRDLKEVNIITRESPQDTLLVYESLNELRRINAEAKVKVLFDITGSNGALNTATFMALALERSLLDVAAIANVGRIMAKIHVINNLEREQELRWCLTNLKCAADKALEDGVHVTAATCYSTSVPEIFKDLFGFIRFARFASWGMEYQSSGMYGVIEGPSYIVNDDQLRELSRKEGWEYEHVELRESKEKLRIAALDVNAQVLREFLQSALTQASRLEVGTVAEHAELRRSMNYIRSLIKKLGG